MNELAKMVGDIATGEVKETERAARTPKQERGAKGGAARASKLSRQKRTAIARKAAKKRWRAR